MGPVEFTFDSGNGAVHGNEVKSALTSKDAINYPGSSLTFLCVPCWVYLGDLGTGQPRDR